LLLTRHNVYLEGEKLEKVGESSYHVERGSFTTCDGLTPDWRITGKELDITLEGYGTLKHGFFYIKDIPVFYVPWMIYPAKRERQTGFLVPTLSNSSQRGFDVRLPFFLNLSPSADLTIVPRICTKRAFQTSAEFRYVPWEDFQGRFYGEYTYDWQYAQRDKPQSNRFYATWQHDQEVLDLLRLKVNGNWVSDRDYFEFWGGRFDRRRRVRYLESNAVLYRQWDNFLFQSEARYFHNLDLPDNATTVHNLPIITGTVFNQQVPYTPLYLSSKVAYDNFYAPQGERQWLGSRFKADTKLSLPLGLSKYVHLNPSVTYFAKAYAADYYEKDKPTTNVTAFRGDLFQVGADAYTNFFAVYNRPFAGFQRLKHTIRPRLSWVYRPESDSGQIFPEFDESDRLEDVSRITAELRQTLTGRLGPDNYLDVVTFSLLQSYDFAAMARQARMRAPGEELLLSEGWTDAQAELTVRPHSLIDLIAQAHYDPVHNRARRYSVNLGLMDHRGDLMRVVHHFVEDDQKKDLNRQTNVNLQVKLTSNLDCFIENQYTHQFDFSYFTSLGLMYSPQCWNVVLRYSQVREQDPQTRRIKDPDQTVFLTLSLYGLGQVYHMTKDWSEILGMPDRIPSSFIN
jgi:LPS-assembly protein